MRQQRISGGYQRASGMPAMDQRCVCAVPVTDQRWAISGARRFGAAMPARQNRDRQRGLTRVSSVQAATFGDIGESGETGKSG
ncbi:MAG: hypothetical protein CMO06_05885 [Thalassospira sp.]|nr:hypothetical protein [Thalassospira sp.]